MSAFHTKQRGPRSVQALASKTQVAPHTETGDSDVKVFSDNTLRLCWLSFVIIHAYCWVYFAAMALCYWGLPGTTLDVWLYLYGLSLGAEYDLTIAVILGALAAIHFCFLMWMLGWSILKRRFVFAVYDVFSTPPASSRHIDKGLRQYAKNLYHAVLSSIGLLSVDSPYFDFVLICREIVETALQTNQAYRMSLLLPRTQLNRFYVALLVLNCWSTVLIHSTFHKFSTKRRLYIIVCDSILDMMTSVGISTVLLAIYAGDYDFEHGEFPSYKWYEDVWLIHVLSEFQLVLISSWVDLAMRLVFALSMLGNMDNMKKLLCSIVDRSAATFRRNSINRRKTSIVPVFRPEVEHGSSKKRLRAVAESRAMQLFFFMWGAFLLVIHFYAESISTIPLCAMQVKPWGTSEKSCSLFVLDCYSIKISGNDTEVMDSLSMFDHTTMSIRHCPNLEVPNVLTEFSRLKLLKFYNTTIVNWGENAAITHSHHPSLVMLFLVRVNMTHGQLPIGLLSNNFPRNLMDIVFCFTNLRTLPDDLDLKWPKSGKSTIYFEASNLSEVPGSLVRLAPFVLSLALNPISNIPASLLGNNAGYLHVGGTRISELPQTANVAPYFKFRVDNTNISFFWDWVDPMVASTGVIYNTLPTILATGSPYCTELQHIFDGNQWNFSAPMRNGQSLILSDGSPNNWMRLKRAVSCEQWAETLYPIEFEDRYSKTKVEVD